LDEVLDLQGAQFGPAQAVVEENGEDGPVALALERLGVRSTEELAGLVVGDGRCLALVGPFGGPLHPVDRVDGDGVLLAEVIEEVGERGELPANRRRGEGLLFESFLQAMTWARFSRRNSVNCSMPTNFMNWLMSFR
jgi:hypothetical protein